jgi:alpha-ketoglutarate-dependent taurine dioxygenase
MSLEAGQLLNVFSQTEIDKIISALKKLPNAPNTGSFRAYTNGFNQGEIMYHIMDKLVFQKLQKQLNRDSQVRQGMYLKEQVPWVIHTDYATEKNYRPDLVYLIPLQVMCDDPLVGKTHTVVFDQSCETDFAEYKQTHNTLLHNAMHLFEQHCSHCRVKDLEYVSAKGVYEWQIGSVIYWDNRLLHCSDNFIKNYVKEKQALVLFAGW